MTTTTSQDLTAPEAPEPLDDLDIVPGGKPRRMTRLRRRRRSFDLIIASHHFYGGMGLRRLARHFAIPRSTVRDAIHRVDKDDPELRETAVRWGHLRMEAEELGVIPVVDPLDRPDLVNLLNPYDSPPPVSRARRLDLGLPPQYKR